MTSQGSPVAEAFVTIRPDFSELGTELQRGLGGQLDQIGRSTAFTQLGVAAGIVTLGIDKMSEGFSGLFGQLNRFTSELAFVRGESITINTIFGEAAESIFRFGDQSAKAVGLSSRAFEELVAPVGQVLKNLAGLSETGAAEAAIELTKRASDLAFTFNTDVDDALVAIGASLRGEQEPIRNYGISMTEASVANRALADTGKENVKQLTEQDKVQARLNIIMEQSADFAGAFARGEDTLFVSTKQAAAEQANQAGIIGSTLQPVMRTIIDLFNDLPPSVRLGATAIMEFSPAIIDFASGLGLAVIGISGLIGPLAALAPVLIPLIAIPAAVGLAMVALGISFDDLKRFAHDAWVELQNLAHLFELGFEGGVIGGDFNDIQTAAFNLGQEFKQLSNALIGEESLLSAFEYFAKGLQGYDIGGEFGKINQQAYETGRIIREDIAPTAETINEWAVKVLDALGSVNRFFDDFRETVSRWQEEWQGDLGLAQTNLGDYASFVVSLIDGLINYLEGAFGRFMEIVNGVVFVVTNAWNFISQLTELTWKAIGGTVERVLGEIWDHVERIMSIISGVFNFWMAIVQGDWGRAWDEIKRVALTIVEEIFNGIDQILGRLPSTLYNIGKDAFNGFKNGIEDAARDLPNIVEGIFKGIVGLGEKILGPFLSPSHSAENMGRLYIEGLAKGLKDSSAARAAQQTMSSITAAVGAGVQQWAGLVAQFFPLTEVARALNVMALESGGNPRAIGVNADGSLDVGLFQINDVHGLSVAARLDPLTNIRYAAQLFAQQGWSPWVAAQKLGYAHSGLNFVPTSGLYELERGERVLTAAQNESLGKLFNAIPQFVSTIVDTIVDAFEEIVLKLEARLTPVANAVEQVSTPLEEVATAVEQIGSDIVHHWIEPWEGFTHGWVAFPSWVTQEMAKEIAAGALPDPFANPYSRFYQMGTDFVPQTGWAYLHRGEAVIPAGQNRGITVNNYGPVYARDEQDARASMFHLGSGLALQLRLRGAAI